MTMSSPSVSRVVRSAFSNYYREIADLILPSFVWLGFFITVIFAGSATVSFYRLIRKEKRERSMDEYLKDIFHFFLLGLKMGLPHTTFLLIFILSLLILKKGEHTLIASTVFFLNLYMWFFFSFLSLYVIPLNLDENLDFHSALRRSMRISFRYSKYTFGLVIQIFSLTFLSVLSVVGFPLLFPSLFCFFLKEGYDEIISVEVDDLVRRDDGSRRNQRG